MVHDRAIDRGLSLVISDVQLVLAWFSAALGLYTLEGCDLYYDSVAILGLPLFDSVPLGILLTEALDDGIDLILPDLDLLLLEGEPPDPLEFDLDRQSTRLNSSHVAISYAVFC